MKRKVTLKVFTPLLHEFEAKLDALHVKRDAFLNHLIDCELPHLENDLHGKRLAVSIRRYIARSLKRLGCSQINVQVDSATAERLDEIAIETNLVRDSFINRLLYFSVGSDALLQYFGVPLDSPAACQHQRATGYFRAIHEIQADPLGSLRTLVKAKHGVGLHLAPLPLELAAFECYLDDETFWGKYDAPGNAPVSTTDLLQSFESAAYRARPTPARESA